MDDLERQHAIRHELPPPGVTGATLEELSAALVDCRACPRLVQWREQVARERRAAFATEEYWGRPVPGFGDPNARLVVVGLAPAAHGANRTGRMFTGDRSGDWLFRALHRNGFANQPTSRDRRDGLRLVDAWITGAVRCAPPGNRPTPPERDACGAWLDAELRLLNNVVAYVCLGAYAYVSLWRSLGRLGLALPRPRPRFRHGLTVALQSQSISASYHPSQQNTFTGKLTEEMLDDVLQRVRQAIDG